MKVTFNDHIETKRGKCHDGKHVYYTRNGIPFMRNHRKGATTANQIAFGQKMQKVVALYPTASAPFKTALNQYARAYSLQIQEPAGKSHISGYNVWVKALCSSTVSMPALDSLNDIATLYGSTIPDWINNGLLPRVKGALPVASML